MIAPTMVVVDDDPLVLPVITTALSEAGFRVLSSCDSDTAIRLLEREKGLVDLLFTDVVMPGSVDGLKLACLAAARWPSIAIIVSSGRVVPRTEHLPLQALFLPKPFGADHLLWFVRRAMSSKGHVPPQKSERPPLPNDPVD